MGKFLVSAVTAGLMFSAAVKADMPLSERDKDQIIGEYFYAGPFKDMTINVVLDLYKNAKNELQGGGKFRGNTMPEGQWMAVEFHTFRRLSSKEWTDVWKVTDLPGERCDQDRLCIVAVNESSLNEDQYDASMRLMQFESDFSSFQSYTVPKKGEPGYLGVIITKRTGAQEISGLPSKSLQLEIELEFWKSVAQDDTVALYQAYLKQFPDGVFVPIAKLRIEQGKSE